MAPKDLAASIRSYARSSIAAMRPTSERLRAFGSGQISAEDLVWLRATVATVARLRVEGERLVVAVTAASQEISDRLNACGAPQPETHALAEADVLAAVMSDSLIGFVRDWIVIETTLVEIDANSRRVADP